MYIFIFNSFFLPIDKLINILSYDSIKLTVLHSKSTVSCIGAVEEEIIRLSLPRTNFIGK